MTVIVRFKKAKVVTIEKRNKLNNSQEKKVLWVKPTIMDIALHKMAKLEILRELAKRKYSNYLMAPRSRDGVPFRTENSRVHMILIPLRYVPVISPAMYAIALFFFLPIYVIALKPDFIIGAPDVSILSFIPTLLFSKFKKVRFILDVRSIPVETFGFRGSLTNFWFATSILVAKKLFDSMTIITSLMKKEVCNRFGINPDKVGVWTSGVSTKLFYSPKYISGRHELRRKLGLSEKFVVFYHGIFTATRGLVETIEAIKILGRAYPNVVMFFLGTGPIVSMLKDLIQRGRLQDNVIIHNPVDYAEVPRFIDMSDVCVVPLPDHPYWRFQCPLKLLEYLAMEKVVIVTDIPAHRSIIGEEKCGVYISSIKPIEIAKSIVYAYHNKEKLEEWGKFGRTIINEEYTWEKVATDLENYLLSIDDRVGLGV